MLLGRKLRPSSASGKLETHQGVSLLNEIRKSSKPQAALRRAQTAVGSLRWQSISPGAFLEEAEEEESPAPPEWLERELITRQQRRYSVGLMENVADNIQRRTDPTRSLRKGKIEQQVTLKQLQIIKAGFKTLEQEGHTFLDVEKFKWIVKKQTGLRGIRDEQIEELFMKIDYTAGGRIHWNDFCTYMQLEYAEHEAYCTRLKKISFSLPATVQDISHGEPILRVFSMPDDTLVMVREDGTIHFWSPELRLKRSKLLFEKPINKTPKWVTDFSVMTQYNKLMLATGDREIQLYELSNLEPYCQISGLETVPLKLDYCSTDPDECIILYGDDQGCVNLLLLKSVGELLRTWKKLPRVDNMPNIGIDYATLSPHVTFISWKVHEDWVTQLKYYDSIKAIISTSNHQPTALVLGCTVGTTNVEQQMRDIKDHGKESKVKRVPGMQRSPQRRAHGDSTVFQVYKGVKTFAFCKANNLIVTGGIDRIIRMWNPYMPGRTTGKLIGHTAPIFHVDISADDNKIFSIATDNIIKIWDIQDQSCMLSVCSKTSGIRGELTACHFTPSIRALVVASDTVALLPLRNKPVPQPHLVVSHKEPVLCSKFNREFRQVVSCSEGSVVKVWDFESGRQVFEFSDAHGDAGITCMTFDLSGRRLVSGGRDGCLKIWNYNNGHCLHTLKTETKGQEVCDCTYVDINRNRYIIAVGWDKRINMYYDLEGDLHHFRKPLPHWQDDLSRGHREDVLCVAQCPPDLLATSSYDGEIIVWNMISGHLHCRLTASAKNHAATREQRSVSKLVFLQTRTMRSELAAALVSNGPQGSVKFWSIFNGGHLIASFTPSRVEAQVSGVAVTVDNAFLFVADSAGYVHVYDIQDYALHGPEPGQPKYINHWRAHVDIITTLQLVDEDKVLLTSSLDCAVRLWSMEGEFIGTFGQLEPWEIFTPASWKHPMVPYEILVDPESMPVHPILEEESSTLQGTTSDIKEESKERSNTKDEISYKPKVSQIIVTDADIKEEIRMNKYSQGLGKRLRHEHYKSSNKPLNHGGPNEFHKLQYFDIENSPFICEKPDLSAAGTDFFKAILHEE
ncbi:cilia- and flagella-associated protein 337-like [Lissotriton helveticus]